MFDWWFNYSGVEIFGSFLFGCICVIVLLLGSFDKICLEKFFYLLIVYGLVFFMFVFSWGKFIRWFIYV